MANSFELGEVEVPDANNNDVLAGNKWYKSGNLKSTGPSQTLELPEGDYVFGDITGI